MSQARLLLVLPLLLCGLSCDLLSTKEAGPVELFDGKDLSGWDFFLVDPAVSKDEVWSLKDGILICKGEPLGYLATKAEYASFHLVVEWRWAPGVEGGNSGILMRINGEPKGIPRCLEAQLQSGNAGEIYGLQGMGVSGVPERSFELDHEIAGHINGVHKVEAAENPVGEWNVAEVTLDGPSVTVTVNGKKVNEATGAEVVSGPIGLQSEGGEIHFRRVTLTPIAD
jgi:hypothetical protein